MTDGGLDIALMVVLGYFFIRGLFRGVVKEVVAVLGFFVAFWVASVYWPMGSEHLRPIFDVPGQRGVTSFILIFVVVYFLISIISMFVDKIIKLTISPLGSGLLGAAVGLLKGILVCGILLAGAETFLKPTEKFFTTSTLWPYIQPVTNQAKAWMPEVLRGILRANKQFTPILPSQDEPTSAAPPPLPTPASLMLIEGEDWQAIENVLATQPGMVTSDWKDKLLNMADGEALTPDDLKRFIADHPGLFEDKTSPDGAVPTWPQPAQ